MAGFDPDVFGGQAGPGFDKDVFGSAPSPSPVPVASLPQKPKGTGSDWADAGNAVGTGYWRGMTRLAGLPVDTVANVLDLGKAAIGSGYQAITGKPAPDALQLSDRSSVVGSGDWLLKKFGQTDAGNLMVNPVNPDYEGGYLQNAGSGLTAVMAPNNIPQALNQAAIGLTSTAAGKAVMDATGNPALAIAASMGPSGVQQAVTNGTTLAIRGGEQSRKQMEQRIQDLKNAGINQPTLGLASGNKVIGGVENILQSTPGAVGVMSGARDRAVNALQEQAQQAAAAASPNRGALESGTAIQSGLNDFRTRFKQGQEQAYGKLDNFIPGDTRTSVANTSATLADLNADIPGAPAMSKFFKNGKILALEGALKADTGNAPKGTLQEALARNPLYDGATGQPLRPRPMPTDELPWEAVKKTRTMVGKELADNTPFSDVPRSKWNPLYGALSQDMGAAANAAGPDATRAFNRATDYTRAGMGRLDRVAPFANMTAPEQAYTAMVNASRENVSTLQAVKKTLPPDARGTIAGTVIERLGRSTNGVQNHEGTAWSPETFLTNWNKMTPRAREELFSGFPNSSGVNQSVESVARAASMMRDSSKMWANPSGSGANVAARATLGALGVGGGASALGLLNPALPVAVGGGLLGTHILARSLTSPTVVNAMAQSRGYVSPQLLNAQFNALVAPGLLSQ